MIWKLATTAEFTTDVKLRIFSNSSNNNRSIRSRSCKYNFRRAETWLLLNESFKKAHFGRGQPRGLGDLGEDDDPLRWRKKKKSINDLKRVLTGLVACDPCFRMTYIFLLIFKSTRRRKTWRNNTEYFSLSILEQRKHMDKYTNVIGITWKYLFL